ncbi:Dihydrofolate reductase [Seinonella peptonophila]|uniref:Dihydrofolate reductase n=1 Tax=Seinonella peptonophila TaxID=112248 RepID=A0A1M4Y647_9BACL|nr:dihydrofolate reductase family protein [Seinonella peptonophila]SHF01231.1 Dihydrofolate reductase [Seinonella peptonophila]
MRKVIVSEFISLDGVIENPEWTFQFGSDEQQQYKYEELKESDALLLGRVTYEGFAANWPNMIEQTGEYGQWMNNYPKYVISNTLDKAEWNNSSVVKGDIAKELKELKEQPGKDILVFGSGALIQTLAQLDLVDEYRLMTFPIVLGKGQRLFGEGFKNQVLKLIDTKTFETGVQVLTYQVNRD